MYQARMLARPTFGVAGVLQFCRIFSNARTREGERGESRIYDNRFLSRDRTDRADIASRRELLRYRSSGFAVRDGRLIKSCAIIRH